MVRDMFAWGKRQQPPGPASEQAVAGQSEDDLVRALYQEHGRSLYGYVVRLTSGDRQWAEDIVQETLFRAWRSADKLGDDPSSLRPWLFTVARRLVIDGQRSKKARPQEVGAQPLEVLPAPDELDRTLSSMTVMDALQSLSAAHREVLVETYYQGRTVAEAAERLGVPVGTVKSRVYYALRSLRLALEERGVVS
jgi:RNA polymerase sigma-70 factor, ECF subfamily